MLHVGYGGKGHKRRGMLFSNSLGKKAEVGVLS